MPKMIDITGEVFNRFTVLEFVKKDTTNSYWRVRCECGKIRVLPKSQFVYGGTKSCGCLREEVRMTGVRFGRPPSPQKRALMARKGKNDVHL